MSPLGSQPVIAAAPEEATVPSKPLVGVDHFGLRVDDLDQAAEELKKAGVEFTMEPTSIAPNVKIAFITAPDGVSIELVQFP